MDDLKKQIAERIQDAVLREFKGDYEADPVDKLNTLVRVHGLRGGPRYFNVKVSEMA